MLKVNDNRDKRRLRSKFLYAVLEKVIFENFQGPLYDDVIYRNVSYYLLFKPLQEIEYFGN